MSYLVSFFTQILSTIVKPLNDRFASKMSGYNLVVQQSMGAFDIAGDVDDFSKIFITPSSKGSQPFVLPAIGEGTDRVTITWLSQAGVGSQLATDKAYAVLLDQATGLVHTSSGSVARSANALTFIFPDSFIVFGHTYSVYLSFRKLDGTAVYAQSYQELVAD
jgi:hypothetical protein